VQRRQPIVSTQVRIRAPKAVKALPTTAALPTVAALPATAALPTVAALPATAVLAIVTALPATAALAIVVTLPATAVEVSSGIGSVSHVVAGGWSVARRSSA